MSKKPFTDYNCPQNETTYWTVKVELIPHWCLPPESCWMDSVALSVKLFEIFGFESGRRKFEGREKEKDMKAVNFYVALYS